MTDHATARADKTAVTDPAAKQIYLHVGAPKTGTTALQNFLWHNRYELARRGICYPLKRASEHYGAGMDVRNDAPALAKSAPPWVGAWQTVAGRMRDWHGPAALFSGEFLGAAARDRIMYALSLLEPAEIHVIVTARDLVRQIPSDWQEQVKHRRSFTLDDFAQQLVEGSTDRGGRYVQMFWRQHDPAELLGTWSEFVPPERIHLVTLPPSGSPRELLMSRFLSVVGLDLEAMCFVDQLPSNPSLGAAEVEFLRRINPVLQQRMQNEYAPLVRELVAENVLGQRADQQKIELPREYFSWARARAGEIVDQLSRQSYDVVGSLDELLPAAQSGDPLPLPQKLSASAIAPVANDVVVGLLTEVAELRAHVLRLRKQITQLGERPSRRPSSSPADVPDHPEHGTGNAFQQEFGVDRSEPEDRAGQRGPQAGRRGRGENTERAGGAVRGAGRRAGRPGPGGARRRRPAERSEGEAPPAREPAKRSDVVIIPGSDYMIDPDDADGHFGSGG